VNKLMKIEGWSMMEQGFYKDEKLIFHLKQFLRRSFGVGTKGMELDIREVKMKIYGYLINE
jgi:hypothetical protein